MGRSRPDYLPMPEEYADEFGRAPDRLVPRGGGKIASYRKPVDLNAVAELGLSVLPGSGDAIAIREGRKNFQDMGRSIEAGDYGKATSDAIMGGYEYLSAAPVIGAVLPSIGGVIRAVKGVTSPSYDVGSPTGLVPAEAGEYVPVPGKPAAVKIPEVGPVEARPIKQLQDAKSKYMQLNFGAPGKEIPEYPKFDKREAERVARAFDIMQHKPDDPRVKRAYDAMVEETIQQYRALQDSGLDVKFMTSDMADPYAASPSLGYKDIVENGRLWVFPTELGHGSDEAFDTLGNPLLKRVGRVGDKSDAVANDAFRVVHDVFGHFAPGNPFFRAPGEERAFVEHAGMYSDEARGAMASETRGQNSWVNYGPHGEANRTASGADTVFADQKVGLMPRWASKVNLPMLGGMVIAPAAALAAARVMLGDEDDQPPRRELAEGGRVADYLPTPEEFSEPFLGESGEAIGYRRPDDPSVVRYLPQTPATPKTASYIKSPQLPIDIDAAVRASVMPSPSDPNYLSVRAAPMPTARAAPATARGALTSALSGLPGNAAQTIAGGPGSELPMDLGMVDIAPFAGGVAMGDDWKANPDYINSLGVAMTAVGVPGIVAKGAKRAMRAGSKAVDSLLNPSIVDDIADAGHQLQVQRGSRSTLKTAKITSQEREVINAAVTDKAERKKLRDDVLKAKKAHPVSDGWMPMSEPRVKDGKLEWKKAAYGFNKLSTPDKVSKKAHTEFHDLAERARAGDPNALVIFRQAGWYKNVRGRLREEYGGMADVMVDALGASSAQTNVKENWALANQALRRFSKGEFDETLARYADAKAEGLGPKEYMKRHEADPENYPIIRKENGMKFGINTMPIMDALLASGMWRNPTPGSKPKTKNFAGNLGGFSTQPTIDVWAARMMQRLAGGKRVPPRMEQAVTGTVTRDAAEAGRFDATGEFGFGQQAIGDLTKRLNADPAFREAAGLREGEMLGEDDVQAMMWFQEKEHWTKNNWTSKEGEGGSIEQMMDNEPHTAWQAGISITQDAAPTDAAQEVAREEMMDALTRLPGVTAVKVQPTAGVYAGDAERAFDVEVIANEAPGRMGPSQFDVNAFTQRIIQTAKDAGQTDAFVSRIIPSHAVDMNPNARPGLSVSFRNQKALEEIKDIIKTINDEGADGLTMTVDLRHDVKSSGGADPEGYTGLRMQWVPEISARFDDDMAAEMADPDRLQEMIVEQERIFAKIADAVGDIDGVIHSEPTFFDTLVVGKEAYDDYLPGTGGDASPRVNPAARFGQPLSSHVAGRAAALGRGRAGKGGNRAGVDSPGNLYRGGTVGGFARGGRLPAYLSASRMTEAF